MNDVFVRCVEMPLFVKGQVLLDDNGDYNVYINNKYPVDIQEKTLKHELEHISNDDFYSTLPIEMIEKM